MCIHKIPGAPLTYSILMMAGGGGQSEFFGSKILAKSDFFGSMKDARIFLGYKKTRPIFGGCEKRTDRGIFWGYAKK